MIGIQQMLVVAANTPAETPVVVDVAGNGVALMNPTWVEWLMGYPLGHTACAGWETPSSRKSPRGSSRGLRKSNTKPEEVTLEFA